MGTPRYNEDVDAKDGVKPQEKEEEERKEE
jgi:hypothetical protein